jgi:hypothetical protein
MRYEHTQTGYLTMAVLFAAAVFLALTGIVAPADQRALLFVVTIEVILSICAVVFSKLTIKIHGETLRASFAMGTTSRKSGWPR